MKAVVIVEIALRAGRVAKAALEFQDQTTLVDAQVKKYFMNNLIGAVNELKQVVMESSDLLDDK